MKVRITILLLICFLSSCYTHRKTPFGKIKMERVKGKPEKNLIMYQANYYYLTPVASHSCTVTNLFNK